ncbi:hypothetical protein ACN20G_11800 [Streptomyces sp. BI20]|uniref:hypothetical protein n=1 Tax=Streptomyces sp. BI20 TaxID=3403460 RepID=UPI003C78995B
MSEDVFPALPDLPVVVAEYLVKLATKEGVGSPPWEFGGLPASARAGVLEWLDGVARWLNHAYAWQPEQVIPPCWAQHPGLALDLAGLAFARLDLAREPAGSAVVWHERYERALTRWNTALGRSGNDCRAGQHEHRPARVVMAAWGTPRTHSTEDAVRT